MTDPRLTLFKLYNSEGSLTDANQIDIDTSTYTGNLDSSVSDVQQLAEAVDTLSANQVANDSTNQTGQVGNADSVQQALDIIDAVLPSNISFRFSGSYAATSSNSNEWFSGRANIHLQGVAGSNSVNTFTLPGTTALNAVFDALVAKNLEASFSLTLSYLGGSPTASLTQNRLSIVPRPSPSPQLATGTSLQLRYGQFTTLHISRDDQGTISDYTVTAGPSVLSAGELPSLSGINLRDEPWNASSTGQLPTGTQVQEGYAFKVSNAPADGSGRFGEVMYNDDWVVWEGSTFTSWDAEPHQWFVIAAHEVRRTTQEQSNFLSQVTEIDTSIQRSVILNDQTEVLFWFTPALFSSAPFLTPSSDTNNPRAGQTESYVGGREVTSDGVFEQQAEIPSHFLYVALSPSYYSANQDDIRIRIDNSNGTEHFDFSLKDDFVSAGSLGTAQFQYFYLSPEGTAGLEIGYGSFQQVYAYIGSVRETFQLSSNVDINHNLRNVGEVNLDQDTVGKLNKQISLDRDDRVKLDNITETTTTGAATVLTTFMFKTGGASVDTSDYQNGRYLFPGFTTTKTYTVVIPDTQVLTGHQVVGGSTIAVNISEISPSLLSGKRMYTVTVTNGSNLIELLAAETTVTQLEFTSLYRVQMGNLSPPITRQLDHVYTLPEPLKVLAASARIDYTDDQGYLSINPYIFNHNSFVILKDTPADGTTHPITDRDVTSFNQIDNSAVNLHYESPNIGDLLIANADGSGGIAQYSIPMTGSGLFAGWIRSEFPDSDNHNILVSGWINSNKMQLFDHSEFIRVKEHNSSNYRTICSFNDEVFSYHVGNEDSTAGTPRNLRHYQGYLVGPGTTGGIDADIGQGQTAGFGLDRNRLAQGNTGWTIFLTLFEDGIEHATDSFVYSVTNRETDQATTTTNIGFDDGTTIKTVGITANYIDFYSNGFPNYQSVLSVGSSNLASNQSLRVQVYYETAGASTSGSDLTLTRVNAQGWNQDDFGIHKVAVLFGRNQDSDLQLTVAIDGSSVETVDMRYPIADLDFSEVEIGCSPNLRGRVQNIQGVQFPTNTPEDHLPSKQVLLDWVKNNDAKEDVLFDQFQRPDKHVETLEVPA